MATPVRRSRDPRRVAVTLRVCAALLAVGARVAPAQTLYWIDTSFNTPTLHRSNAFGAFHTSVSLTPGTLPEGLAVDAANARLFWVESRYTGARLMKAFDNLSGASPLLIGTGTGRGLVLDPAAHELYWTTSNLAQGPDLRAVGTDGSSQNVIASFGSAVNPRGVALDDAGGTAYWADFDGSRIDQTDLHSGLSAPVVTLAAGSGPYGVAHAPSSPYLYWTEYNTGRLSRSTMAGGAVTVLASGLHNPTYLAIDTDNSRLLWIEAAAGAQKIRSMPLAGGAITDLPVPVSSFGGIAIKPGVFVGVEPGNAVPGEFALESVAPNPTASAATISFALPRDATTQVRVLDVTGRVVVTLEDGVAVAGRHAITWDGTDAGGRHVAPGLYFVRVSAGDRHLTGRLVVMGR